MALPKKDTYTKIIWQYSRELSPETMDFLTGIAADYAKVKGAVYERFSGIRSMNRLTPVYTVMTLMRHCGLREQLGLPVVYYELAVADAVSDIKGMWSLLKNRLRETISESKAFTNDEKMYLRTVLRIDSLLSDILNGKRVDVPEKCRGIDIDPIRLNKWLCSRIRKYRHTPGVGRRDYFRVSPNGYKYGDGGIYIAGRQIRKRVCIPLRDSQEFDRQIVVNIRDNTVALAVPVECDITGYDDYVNTIYMHIGYHDMFTLSNGNIYGKDLGQMVTGETERLNNKNKRRLYYLFRAKKYTPDSKAIKNNNIGIKKYYAKKLKARRQMETFINTEIGRLFRAEKPGCIVTTAPVTKNKTVFKNPKSNRIASRRFESYIRKRLSFKCMQHSIRLIEINSKGTGSICSECGAEGIRGVEGFSCPACGYKGSFAENGARNIEKKYKNGTGKKRADA